MCLSVISIGSGSLPPEMTILTVRAFAGLACGKAKARRSATSRGARSCLLIRTSIDELSIIQWKPISWRGRPETMPEGQSKADSVPKRCSLRSPSFSWVLFFVLDVGEGWWVAWMECGFTGTQTLCPSGQAAVSVLPDAADFFWGLDHGLAGFAGEGLGEFGHVHDYAVDAVLGGRVRIDLGAHA
jgi:hypothetical protein